MTIDEVKRIVCVPDHYCATFVRRGKQVSEIITVWAVWDVGEAQGLGVVQPVIATADEWILLSSLISIASLTSQF